MAGAATATAPKKKAKPVVRELHLVSPALSGADVTEVQKRLRAAGYAPGAVDGVYGHQTAAAVELFQLAHGLDVDGVVGAKTRAALAKPEPKPPLKPGKKSVGYLSLAESVRHLGVKESPANSNHQKFGPALGMPDMVPWCAEFTSYATLKGADYILCHGASGPGVFPKGCTYVPTVEAWLRSSGKWLGRMLPVQDGWVAIYNWDGGVPDHIGLAATAATLKVLVPGQFAAALREYGPLGSDEFWSVEGNTSLNNNSNGGEVMLRKRRLTQVDGFGVLR